MLGGDHGRLKHGPPEGHSPVSESLMPKERLRIEPCFHLGNIPKGLVCGPAEVRDYTAFVPHPVDTSHVRIAFYTVRHNYRTPYTIYNAKMAKLFIFQHKRSND